MREMSPDHSIQYLSWGGALARLLLAALLLPFLFACSAVTAVQNTVEDKVIGPGGRSSMDLASAPVIYFDAKIQKAEMQVMVHPNVNLEAKPSALFVPFGVTQQMQDAAAVSQGVSTQLWQAMLQGQAFSVLEMAPMRPPYRVDMALSLARSMGAEMMVGGYVTYYFDGGSNRDSKISIQMEVYDVASASMVWSVAHAAVLPAHNYNDFLLFETHQRMPEDPMSALIRAIGADFATLLHMWTEPEAYREPAQGKSYFEPAFGSF